jgi:outer membrane lipoprotein-sorting protein
MKTVLSIIGILNLALLLQAQTAQEIANAAATAAYYKGDDGRAQVSMSIVDQRGRERSRAFTILRRNSGEALEGQQFYVLFNQPADIADTAFLVEKHVDKDDDRWLYLPALDLVRRIASSDERTSFVGSHFFYEDVSGRSPTEDTHELLETSDLYYVLKSVPKEPADVEFAYFKSWIHKASSIPIKTEYTNSKGEISRTYEALKVENIDGIPTVVQSKMTDSVRGGSTTLTYSTVQYNNGLKSSIFSERSLRNPPTSYLQF